MTAPAISGNSGILGLGPMGTRTRNIPGPVAWQFRVILHES